MFLEFSDKIKVIISHSAAMFFVIACYSARAEDLIENIHINNNCLKVSINSSFKDRFLHDDFFVEYDTDIDLSTLDYEIVTMPFIMNVISMVWISGKNYYIDSMEKELYESLETIKKIFKFMYPNTAWDGNLIPKKLTSLTAKFHKIHETSTTNGLLFSGGLDSTSSFFEHMHEKLLLITARGQYDLPLDKEENWAIRKNKIEDFGHSYNQRTAFLKSNYSKFLKTKVLKTLSPEIWSWRTCTIEGIGWAGLVAPILVIKECARLYLPSSFSWYYPETNCFNPFVDNSIKFAGFQLQHDQFGYDRLHKNEFIAKMCSEEKLEKPFIKTCQKINRLDTNCCNCAKCLVTIMGFIAVGENPADYGFPITIEHAVSRVLRFLKHPVTPLKAFAMTTIQNRLRDIRDKTGNLPEGLVPFVNLDLQKLIIPIKDRFKRFKWEDLHSIVPAIEIPKNLDAKLLSINL